MRRIKKDALFLIDGSSILYRSYYAIRPLYTSKGVPTQAVYGFCRAIKKMIDDFDPKHMIVVWDAKGKTFRKEIYKEYKATREAPPSDLFTQKEQIIEFIDLIDLHQTSKSGYEADDLIATLTKKYKNKKQIVIVGPDKDLFQLIDKDVFMYDPAKKELTDPVTFKKNRGFEPEKLAFYHAIVGDASDNIPGVKGIGKKGATELVQQFRSLDDLYKNLDAVKKDRIRSLLQEHKEDAFLSLKLFTLKEVSVKITLKDIVFDKANWANADDFFKEMEFSSLLEAKQVIRTKKEQEEQMALFEVKSKGAKAKKWTCHIVQTEDELEKLIVQLKKKKIFGFDTETTGCLPLQDELVGCSFAFDNKNGYYIPFIHEAEEGQQQLEREYVLKKMKSIFESTKIGKTLQNAKFDQLVLWHYGIELKGVKFDTLLAANLLRKEWDKIGLKKLSLQYLNEPMRSFAEVLGKKRKTFAQVPLIEGAQYAAHDALQTYKLYIVLKKELNKERKLKKIFKDLDMPLSELLFRIERVGIALDPEVIKHVKQLVSRSLHIIEKKIMAAIQHKSKFKEINLNSPKQLEELLFDELKLPVIKKSAKGQRSTDQEVLQELSKEHPIPGLIIKYRELFKLKSTYLEPLPGYINSETGRVHTSYSQTKVVTGRLSSSEPNLQNIPAGEGYGLKVREAFIAPRGRHFLSADYSQIELRVLAHITKDKNLIEAFLEDRDIHSQAAAQIFEVPIETVKHEQRQIGKRINFSIVYGLTPFGLAKDLGIKQSEAKEYIERYFEQYPAVAHWIEKIVENARKDGFVETFIMGRRRYTPGLKEKNRALYEAARRITINAPVQGTAAEIMKMAMLDVNKAFRAKKLESEIVLQIHDELVFEVPNSEMKIVETLVKKKMEKVVKWDVPLKVSLRTGKNWAEVTK